MKIKSNKLIALLLALALVFAGVALMANADSDANTYIKVSSVANVNLGTTAQVIKVSLSANTKLDIGAKLALDYNEALYSDVSIGAVDVNCTAAATNGAVVFTATGDINNAAATELTLFTITFTPKANSKGVDALKVITAGTDAFAATINGGTALAVANDVIGETATSYSNLFGIGLEGAITSTGIAPDTAAQVVVNFAPYLNSETLSDTASDDTYAADLVLNVPDSKGGAKIMTATEIKAFLDKNAAAINQHLKNEITDTELTYASFAVDANSYQFNSAALSNAAVYTVTADPANNTYNVTLNQLQETSATIKIVFRTAMDPEYYHGSSIPDYDEFAVINKIYAGDSIYTQATILAYVQEAIDLYNELGENLPADSKGALLNKYIVDNSGLGDGQQYDLSDFTLNTNTVLFGSFKIKDGMTYDVDETKNVYTVYLDQVNVPKEVLMTIAEELGKINYTQFADLNVLIINEAIGAFQAAADSIVNAEWPSQEDVENEKEGGAGSPGTGDLANVSGAIAVALVLTAGALVVVRKRED